MAGWQLAAREGTVVVARGGDGGALLLAAVEPPSSSPKAPSAGSLGHEKLLASGANANGASMHAKETLSEKNIGGNYQKQGAVGVSLFPRQEGQQQNKGSRTFGVARVWARSGAPAVVQHSAPADRLPSGWHPA